MAKKQSKVEAEQKSKELEEELNDKPARKKKQRRWYICYYSSEKPNCWLMTHACGSTSEEAWSSILKKLKKENSSAEYKLNYAKNVDDGG